MAGQSSRVWMIFQLPARSIHATSVPDALVIFEPNNIGEILWPVHCAFVFEKLRLSDYWNGQAVNFDICAVWPRLFKCEAFSLVDDVDSVGRKTHLKDHSRGFQII